MFDLDAGDEPDTYVDDTEFDWTDADGTRAVNVEQDPLAAGRVLGFCATE